MIKYGKISGMGDFERIFKFCAEYDTTTSQSEVSIGMEVC